MFIRATEKITATDLYDRIQTARRAAVAQREETYWKTHRKVAVKCEKHGRSEVVISLKPDGTWTKAACPKCKEEARETERKVTEFKLQASSAATAFRELIGARYEPNPARFENYRCEHADQAKALEICRKFARNFIPRVMAASDEKKSGVGILLIGNFGTGKTHLANSILANLHDQGVDAVYLCAPDLFDDLNGSGSQPQAYLNRLCRVACLVIDELGVQSWSDAERKRIHQIIDRRWSAHLPTIFATNLNRQELTACLGERVMSRLEHTTYRIVFDWDDWRQRSKPSDMDVDEVFGE